MKENPTEHLGICFKQYRYNLRNVEQVMSLCNIDSLVFDVESEEEKQVFVRIESKKRYHYVGSIKIPKAGAVKFLQYTPRLPSFVFETTNV